MEPDIYITLYAQLVAEAKRRDRLEIVVKAKEWVAVLDTPPPRS
jgi:hypothetical protein